MNKWTRLSALAALLSSSLAVDATLLNRLDGDAAYDTALGVTWVTDGSLGADANPVQWAEAVAWVDTQTYLGFSDWRLPTIEEFEHMYNQNMGGRFDPATDGTVVDSVLLTGIDPGTFMVGGYWSSTGSTASSAYIFSFAGGVTDRDSDGHGYYARTWSVRSGDVTLPEPGMLALMGPALVGLFAARWRKP